MRSAAPAARQGRPRSRRPECPTTPPLAHASAPAPPKQVTTTGHLINLDVRNPSREHTGPVQSACREMAQYQSSCLFVVAVLGITLSNGQTSPAQESKVEENTMASLGKEVEDNSRYKTLNANATLLKLLVDDKDGVSRSEVFDMLHSRDDNQDHIDLPNFPEDTEDSRIVLPEIPDSEAEFLQAPPGGQVRKDSQRVRYQGMRGEPVGTAAGIMVVITCSIVCLAYTGLIVWRRIYLKRNGLKHELLRNEENIAETRIEL